MTRRLPKPNPNPNPNPKPPLRPRILPRHTFCLDTQAAITIAHGWAQVVDFRGSAVRMGATAYVIAVGRYAT